MSRTNVIYQTENLFIGPAPSSGYTLISHDGILNNNYTDLFDNYNLLKPLNRVQSAGYSFNVEYTEVKQLGKRGTVYNPLINSPSVNLSFDYLQNSVLNELRLGFNVNYYQDISLTNYYSDNFGQSLISGLIDRKLEQRQTAPYWPMSTRDKRNIYITVGPKGADVNESTYGVGTLQNPGRCVYAFGDSYLTSYTTRGSVGSFPTTAASFICENLEIYSSGSGMNNPALNPQTREYANTNKFIIPTTSDGNNQVTALLPGDINLTISALPHRTGMLALYGTGYSNGAAFSDVLDLGVKFSDIKAQSYDIGMNLNRSSLYSLGYKLPVDRPIVFPVYATLNTSFIVGDNQTGSLRNLFNKNLDYNIKIAINNPVGYSRGGIGIQYDFLRAKLVGYNDSLSIGPSKIVSMDYITELDPDDLSKGLFMSGSINIDIASGGYLLKLNDGTHFLISNVGNGKILRQTSTNIVAF